MIRSGIPILAAAIALQATPPQSQTFRSRSDMVPLFVTATDKSGHLITDLTRGDFQIDDNGKPQPVIVFDNSPQPLRLIVLIDISGSMRDNLPLLRAATSELLKNLREGDLARVGTFGDEISLSPEFTRDAGALVSWLPSAVTKEQSTPLWRSMDTAIGELAKTKEGRRVVLVLSDSKDSAAGKFRTKYISQIEVSDRAQEEDVMVYGVGVYSSLRSAMQSGAPTLGGMMASTIPDPGLGNVAQNTGGGYFELRGRDDLSATFARVAEELHQQYLIGFAPPARDGKVHKVELRVQRKDVKARVRKSYTAPKS